MRNATSIFFPETRLAHLQLALQKVSALCALGGLVALIQRGPSLRLGYCNILHILRIQLVYRILFPDASQEWHLAGGGPLVQAIATPKFAIALS